MPGCSVYRCGNNSSFIYEDNEERPTFHHFPTHPERRKQWTEILRAQGKKPRRSNKNTEESQQEWTPNYTNASICSDHFEDRFILKPKTNRPFRIMTTLTEDAIPTIFGEAANKNRKRIFRGKGVLNNKKRKITDDDELVSTTGMVQIMDCNTKMSRMDEISIQDQSCHQIVIGMNEIPNIDEEYNPADLEVNNFKNSAALEVQMEPPNVQNDLVQNVMAFYDDAVNKNQAYHDSEDKSEIDFTVVSRENISAENEGSSDEIAQMDSQGKVVTLPIGNNQKLCLSVLSKLGGDISCVKTKNDHGPIPTLFFHVTTTDGSSATFRAKVLATQEPQIPTSGSTNPFIDKEFSDIAMDAISEVEDLVKKLKASSINQTEYEKLKVVIKALDAAEEKK